jgi:hypothetical protein
MTTVPPRVRPLSLCSLGVTLAMAFGVPCALAQQPAPTPAPRPAPAPASPVVAPPVQLPPPPAPARTTGAAANRTPTPAPVRPMTPVSPPPDSMRPAAAPATPAAPADAAAQCRDGSFILQPGNASGCATHGGLLMAMPRRTVPPALTRVAPAPVAMQAAVSADAPPPSGSTMRCKDGTYLGGTPSAGACAAYGGLAAILPAPRQAPAQAPRPRRP